MNNIHEKDWAEDSWAGHSGKNSCSDRKIVNKETVDKPAADTIEIESSPEKATA